MREHSVCHLFGRGKVAAISERDKGKVDAVIQSLMMIPTCGGLVVPALVQFPCALYVRFAAREQPAPLQPSGEGPHDIRVSLGALLQDVHCFVTATSAVECDR